MTDNSIIGISKMPTQKLISSPVIVVEEEGKFGQLISTIASMLQILSLIITTIEKN